MIGFNQQEIHQRNSEGHQKIGGKIPIFICGNGEKCLRQILNTHGIREKELTPKRQNHRPKEHLKPQPKQISIPEGRFHANIAGYQRKAVHRTVCENFQSTCQAVFEKVKFCTLKNAAVPIYMQDTNHIHGKYPKQVDAVIATGVCASLRSF